MLLFPCCWHHRTLHSVFFSWLMSVNFRHRKIEFIFILRQWNISSVYAWKVFEKMGKLEQKVQENMNSLDHFCNKYILTTTHHPPQKNINRHGSVQDFRYYANTTASTSTPGDCIPLAMRKCSQSLEFPGHRGPRKSRAKNPDCHTRHGWTYCTQVETQIVAIFVVFGHLSLHLGWNNMKKTTDLLKFCFTNPLITAHIWA